MCQRYLGSVSWSVIGKHCAVFTFGGFPGATSGANTGDLRDTGSIPGSGRSPGEGRGNLLQYSGLENPHGQSNLVGYSP